MEKPQDVSQENRSEEITRSMSTPSYPHPNNPVVPQNPASTLVVGAEYQRSSSPPHSDQGIVGDLIDLITIYFDEYTTATSRHPGAASIAEVREFHELKAKFKTMFSKNRGGLDHRLARAEKVRKPLVMNFLGIVLSFHQGIKLYSEMMHKTLDRDTHRVIEQAVRNFDYVTPDTLESDPPPDIVDFSRKLYLDIKSRVENVGEQLPITSFVHEGSYRTDVGRALDIGLGERSLNGTDIIPLLRYQSFAQNSRTNHSITATVDARQHSTHLEPPRMHYSFSGPDVQGSVASLPDTVTSSSASRASSASTPASSSDCISHGATQGNGVGSQKHLEIFATKQHLLIWDRSQQNAEPYLALIDSGSPDNFITRLVTHERDLTVYPLPDKGQTYKLLGGLTIHASEYVQPDWRFLIGRKRHSKFPFIILEQLPNGLDLVVGKHALNELDIHHLYDKEALTAQPEDGADCNAQERLNRTLQLLDGSTYRDLRQKTLKKDHSDTVQASQTSNVTRLPSQGEISSNEGRQHAKPKT